MFNWESFINGEFCVYLENREQLINFLTECEKKNIFWIDGIEAMNYLPETPCCIDCNSGDGEMMCYKAASWDAETACINENEQTKPCSDYLDLLSKQNKKYKKRIKKLEKSIAKDGAMLNFLKELTEGENELD